MAFEKLISELDRELIRRHRYDKELFEELTQLQLDSGLTHGSRPISPFLRPYFLPHSLYAEIRRAAYVLSGAFEAVTRAALERPELMRLLGVTEKEERFARFDPGYRAVSVNSRLDAFLSGRDFKFLEYNAENPAGVGDQTALERLFSRIPAVREFLSVHPHYFPQPHHKLLETLVKAYREGGGKRERPSIAIVDWPGVDTSGEFDILAEYFRSEGHPSLICGPEELEYDGKHLRRGDFAIDIFYKRVIIHEFLECFDEHHPISRAAADAAVCMANSFRSKIPHKKASFAILSDEAYRQLFTAAEAEAISRHIPWTRRVLEGTTTYKGETVDLLEFVRRERHRFVLKPNDDYGGKGIYFGWESDASEWDDAIETALTADHIVQERAEVERTKIPVFHDGEARIENLTVDFDPYLFMGEVEGGMVRLASGSLVNITQGGGETAMAVLADH